MLHGRSVALLLFVSAALLQPGAAVSQTDPAAVALLSRADSLYEAREYPAAAQAFETALGRAEAAGMAELEIQALLGLAKNYRLTGNVLETLPLLERALDLARRSTLPARALDALYSLGISYHDLARHDRAIDTYEEALTLARTLGEARMEAWIWNGIGSVRYRQGDHAATLDALEQALTGMEPGTSAYVRVLTNVGRAHMYLGEFARAEALYQDARILADSLDDPHLDGLVWNRFAVLYELTGRDDLAWDANQAALALSLETGLRQGESSTLDNLGILSKKEGDLDGALEYLREANAIQLADADYTGAGTTLKNMADVYRLRGEAELARDTYARALAIDLRAGQLGQAILSRLGMSDVLVMLGEPVAALAQADSARAIAERIGQVDLLAQADARRGRALALIGRVAEARLAFETSITGIERLRASLTTDPSKIGFLEDRQKPFQDLIGLLIAQGEALAALEVAEQARGRAFLDLLAGRGIALDGRLEEAVARVDEARAGFQAAVSTPDSVGTVGAESFLALRAAENLQREIDRLAAADEALASLVSVQSLSGAEIAALAGRSRSTIVEYLAGDSLLFVWVVTPGGEIHARAEPVARERLRGLVQRVRSTWEAGLATGLGPGTSAAADLATLHDLLIAPIAAWLPQDPAAIVTIVPHDALFLLPFTALRSADGHYLIERHTLVSAPSASVLAWLDEADSDSVSTTQAGWLGIGDPLPPSGSGLDRLPWAAREIRQVAERLPMLQRKVLTGEMATEAALRELAPRHSVVHLATHGLVSDVEPLGSALLLTPEGEDDGYLRTTEIFGLGLAADLVVLSGCSTGLGKLTGDGMLGLARAFLTAGTPAILVSLWDVSDRATMELMDSFYARRFDDGLRADAALRAAQMEIMQRYPHPYLWAAFKLIGQPR